MRRSFSLGVPAFVFRVTNFCLCAANLSLCASSFLLSTALNLLELHTASTLVSGAALSLIFGASQLLTSAPTIFLDSGAAHSLTSAPLEFLASAPLSLVCYAAETPSGTAASFPDYDAETLLSRRALSWHGYLLCRELTPSLQSKLLFSRATVFYPLAGRLLLFAPQLCLFRAVTSFFVGATNFLPS